MVTKNKIRKALQKALDEKDPIQNGERKIINWPMVKFRHQLKIATEIPQIMSVSFEFTDEEIKNQLTTVILKSSSRTIRETYDYKTDKVECFCIGSDTDAIRQTLDVSECVDFIRQNFPVKKRVVVLRRK